MTILTDDLLSRIRSRAADYDRQNRFFSEDLDELKAAGYLAALVPTELGGAGLSLQQVVREQIRLAGAAPATALAVNMHLIWTGIARTMRDRGDNSLEFVLREAAEGEVFALAISEAGNDLVLFGSRTEALPEADGGYRFTGTKIFTSLSPAWTRLGLFGLDSTSPDAPKLVHAMVERGAAGITILDDWNTLGMRATQSNSTRLEGVRAEPDRVYRRIDPGPSADLLIFSIFANFELLLSAVYTGIGQRAVELAVEAAERRTSASNNGQRKSQDPITRWRIAEAAIVLDAMYPQLDAIASDLDEVVDRGDQWFRALVGVKIQATRTARTVVDAAVRVSGGSSYFASSELGRLYRDVLAGEFHPSNEDSAHATVASALLGPLDE